MSDKLQKFVESFNWVKATDVPWATFGGNLAESTVAVVSTGGVYARGDRPFAIETREDVDESYREIPIDTPMEDLQLGHEHYNKDYARRDINVVFPVERLADLARQGFIGRAADYNYSITGYIPEPRELYRTGALMAARLKEIEADCVLLTPV